MTDLKSFLCWFEGFAENIKKQPTPEQWGRIKARISSISEGGEAAVVAPPVAVQSGPAPMPKPTTEAQWLAQYQAALIDMGLDDESAADFAREAVVNMAADPAASARAAAGPFLN